MNISLTLLLAR